MKIIPICSADRERLRINRFHRFCGFGLDLGKGVIFFVFGGWCGEGVGKGEFSLFLAGGVGRGLERVNFLWIGASGWVDFLEVGF
jgi:hypothetical protein